MGSQIFRTVAIVKWEGKDYVSPPSLDLAGHVCGLSAGPARRCGGGTGKGWMERQGAGRLGRLIGIVMVTEIHEGMCDALLSLR